MGLTENITIFRCKLPTWKSDHIFVSHHKHQTLFVKSVYHGCRILGQDHTCCWYNAIQCYLLHAGRRESSSREGNPSRTWLVSNMTKCRLSSEHWLKEMKTLNWNLDVGIYLDQVRKVCYGSWSWRNQRPERRFSNHKKPQRSYGRRLHPEMTRETYRLSRRFAGLQLKLGHSPIGTGLLYLVD